MKAAGLEIDAHAEAILREIGLIPLTETLPEDVFLVGYPKSGNTWLQNMVAALAYGLNLEQTPFSLIHELIPGHRRNYYRRYGTPMFFKSHKLPRKRYKRVVYLVRDGRDVMVSYQHHFNNTNATQRSMAEILSDPDLYPSQWHDHVEQWLDNRFDSEILIVKYEDMKADTVRELRRVSDFIGLSTEKSVLEHVVAQASFDAMRQREQTFGMQNEKWPKDKAFMRSGQVGSHAKEMSPEDLKVFLRIAGTALQRAGYSVET